MQRKYYMGLVCVIMAALLCACGTAQNKPGTVKGSANQSDTAEITMVLD